MKKYISFGLILLHMTGALQMIPSAFAMEIGYVGEAGVFNGNLDIVSTSEISTNDVLGIDSNYRTDIVANDGEIYRFEPQGIVNEDGTLQLDVEYPMELPRSEAARDADPTNNPRGYVAAGSSPADPATPGVFNHQLVSVNSNGEQSDPDPYTRDAWDASGAWWKATQVPAIDSTGRYVVFQSLANNLVAGDTNDQFDLFVRDTLLSTTKRISVANDGTEANNFSAIPPKSSKVYADNDLIVFQSYAATLDPTDINAKLDVYVYNNASTMQYGIQPDNLTCITCTLNTGHAYEGHFIQGGAKVVFRSNEAYLPADIDNKADIYIYDLPTDTYELVNMSDVGNIISPTASENGNYIAFITTLDDVDGSGIDTNGVADIYVYDVVNDAIHLASKLFDASEAAGNIGPHNKQMMNDGILYLHLDINRMYPSQGYTAVDYNVFSYDVVNDTLARVIENDGSTREVTIGGDFAIYVHATPERGSLSFDTDDKTDTYITHIPSGLTTSMTVDESGWRLTDGTTAGYWDNGSGFYGGAGHGTSITPDGEYFAYFIVWDGVVPEDTNDLKDTFTARNPIYDTYVRKMMGSTEDITLAEGGLFPRVRGTYEEVIDMSGESFFEGWSTLRVTHDIPTEYQGPVGDVANGTILIVGDDSSVADVSNDMPTIQGGTEVDLGIRYEVYEGSVCSGTPVLTHVGIGTGTEDIDMSLIESSVTQICVKATMHSGVPLVTPSLSSVEIGVLSICPLPNGSAGQTSGCQAITGGGLSITAPSSISFPGVDISSTDIHSLATFSSPVVIQDLRDTNVGFTASATIQDFISGTDSIPYTNLQIKTNTVSSAVNSTLTGVSATNQVNTSFIGSGVNADPITIMIANAIQLSPGQWQVTPILDLLINAYTPSGIYSSVMVFTIV